MRKRLGELKQQLGETGFHIALDFKHYLSNEWRLLLKNGKTNLVIDQSRLPYMIRSLGVAVSKVLFVAKMKNGPQSFPIQSMQSAPIVLTKNDIGFHLGTSETIA